MAVAAKGGRYRVLLRHTSGFRTPGSDSHYRLMQTTMQCIAYFMPEDMEFVVLRREPQTRSADALSWRCYTAIH